MKPEAIDKKNEKTAVVTCSSCDRILTNPKEAVHSRKRVMCVACYESLLNPFQESCCSGAVL